MTQTIEVVNVALRPVDLDGGQVLAHGERGTAPDTPFTRAQIDSGLLAAADPVKPLTNEQLREEAEKLGHQPAKNATKADLEALVASGPAAPTSEGGEA